MMREQWTPEQAAKLEALRVRMQARFAEGRAARFRRSRIGRAFRAGTYTLRLTAAGMWRFEVAP